MAGGFACARRGCCREGDEKRSAPALLARDADRGIVGFHDTFGERKPESESFAGACFLRLIKTLEDVRLVRGADADTEILDGYRYLPVAVVDADNYLSPRRRVLDRVIDQNQKQAAQGRRVSCNQRFARRQHAPDMDAP